MKRFVLLVLCLILLLGCTAAPQRMYHHPYFSVLLPEPFEPVDNASAVCFAPYGDPLLSSSVTFSSTELNWYFDSFTKEEYADALQTLCGYETLTIERIENCRIDGHDAQRVSCKVQINQGTHDLILYAISADKIYFFTLLNREGDSYIQDFDSMMATVRLTEGI